MLSFRFCGVLWISQSSLLCANPLFKGIRVYYYTKMRLYHDYHKVLVVVRKNWIISSPQYSFFFVIIYPLTSGRFFFSLSRLTLIFKNFLTLHVSWLYMFRFKTNSYCLCTTCSTAPTRNQKIQSIFEGRCPDVEAQISNLH